MPAPDLFDVPVPPDAPTPDWDALIAERGDPRRYEPKPPVRPVEGPAAKKAYPAPPEP